MLCVFELGPPLEFRLDDDEMAAGDRGLAHSCWTGFLCMTFSPSNHSPVSSCSFAPLPPRPRFNPDDAQPSPSSLHHHQPQNKPHKGARAATGEAVSVPPTILRHSRCTVCSLLRLSHCLYSPQSSSLSWIRLLDTLSPSSVPGARQFPLSKSCPPTLPHGDLPDHPRPIPRFTDWQLAAPPPPSSQFPPRNDHTPFNSPDDYGLLYSPKNSVVKSNTREFCLSESKP